MKESKIFFSNAQKIEERNSLTKRKLHILFVSSGNIKSAQIVPFIKVQAESLAEENIEVDFYRIQGKGLIGYLKNIKELRKKVISENYDLVHAHFTLSGWVTVLAFTGKPIVLSLMGTDAFGRIKKSKFLWFTHKYLTLLTYVIQPFVDIIISKSKNIEKFVWQKAKSNIIPNGVDLEVFDGKRTNYKKELGLKENQKYILFLGNPEDTNKNFALLKSIEQQLNQHEFEVINPYPIPHQDVSKYLSSVDVLVMCSLQEGSPNVVKEAMASNCKGVFTDVGDVKEQLNGVPGYRVIKGEPMELLKGILEVEKDTNCHGHQAIIQKGLDIKTIAIKLRNIYDNLLDKKRK